jgi:DNA repair exonuclease SbcCD ATPase subunit
MRIDRLEVKGFGKLTGRTVTLKKGINIIYGGNEAGKSTLQSFIRGMLYGLKGSGQPRTGWMQPRKRFLPWDGGQFGGALVYMLDDGSICRVERDFEKDTVKLFDSHFNDITNLFDKGRDKQPAFAEKQMGLDEAVFEKTVFIKQLEVRLDENSAAALAGRLANAGDTGFEDISFSRAEKALTEALKNNVGTGRTTTQPLDRLEARLRQLDAECARLQKQQELRDSIRNDLLGTRNRLGRLEAENRYLEQIGELIEIRRALDLNLKQEIGLREAVRKLKELEIALSDAGSVDTGHDSGSSSAGNKLHYASAVGRGSGNGTIYAAVEGKDSGTGRYKADAVAVRKAEDSRKRNPAPLLYLAAAILFAIMLVYSAVSIRGLSSSWIFRFICGVGVISAGAAAFFALKREQASRRLHADEFIGRTESAGLDIVRMGKSAEFMAMIKSVCSDASLLCGRMLNGTEAVRHELKEVTQKLEELSGKLEAGIEEAACAGIDGEMASCFVREELDKVLYDTPIESLTQTWKNEMGNVRKKLFDTALKEKYYEGLLEDSQGGNDETRRVEEETVAVREKIKYLKHRGDALKLAHEVLVEAGLDIRQTFAPGLNSRLSSIISGLTAGRYEDLKGDDKLALKVAVPESGDVKNALSLSGAAADQMYLALRLAMAGILTEGGESLPLIMDEVFSQFDDNRTALALKYLNNAFKNGQVLILTCKQREVELAREMCGDNLNLVEL